MFLDCYTMNIILCVHNIDWNQNKIKIGIYVFNVYIYIHIYTLYILFINDFEYTKNYVDIMMRL